MIGKGTRLITPFVLFLMIGLMMFGVNPANAADRRMESEKTIRDSLNLLMKMEQEKDITGMSSAMRSAKGVAIFPSILKMGLGIGGMEGSGVVLLRASDGAWYGPSFAKISGGSLGVQLGVEETGLVLLLNDDAAVQRFTVGSKFKLGGDASIAAGPLSGGISTASMSKRNASMYSYGVSKGLFAGISLNGSMVEVRNSYNNAYWGVETDPDTALTTPAIDNRVTPLVQELKNVESIAY